MGLPVTLKLTKSAKSLPKSLSKSTQHTEFAGADAGTLKQKQCLDKKCSGTCRTYSVPSGFCLGTQTKGKFAKVSCGGGKVTTTVYTNADCTGSGTASSTAVDKCVADEVGRFFEWLPCGTGLHENVLPQQVRVYIVYIVLVYIVLTFSVPTWQRKYVKKLHEEMNIFTLKTDNVNHTVPCPSAGRPGRHEPPRRAFPRGGGAGSGREGRGNDDCLSWALAYKAPPFK
jgi:hypothetical protein